MTSVTIIVPAWNEERVIRSTLEALLKVDYDKQKCEVIVVAGGDDDTYQVATVLTPLMRIFGRYAVIAQRPEGKNAAIQQGIDEAQNDIIVLLDADTVVSETWLGQMLRPIVERTADLTIANPYPIRRSWVSDYYMIIKTFLLDSITSYSGHSMAFKACSVKGALDYFFERDTRVGVDYLLSKRFSEKGLKIRFVEGACVRTHLPSTIRYFVRCESRWLAALIKIDGSNYRIFASHTFVILSVIMAIPLTQTGLMFSLVANAAYLAKRIRMFLLTFRKCGVRGRSLFGFCLLSYTYHIIGFFCYLRWFAGLDKRLYLSQGERG